MNTIPIRYFDPGFVDCVTHTLTGAQVLFYLLQTWSREPDRSVILWCATGDAQLKVNATRVALSKERKSREAMRTFEIRVSEPWPYTHNGIKGEAIKIERSNGTLATRLNAAYTDIKQRRFTS